MINFMCFLSGHTWRANLNTRAMECRRCRRSKPLQPFDEWVQLLREYWPDIARMSLKDAYRESCVIAGVEPWIYQSPGNAALQVLPGLRAAARKK